jgi:hypothetical protein
MPRKKQPAQSPPPSFDDNQTPGDTLPAKNTTITKAKRGRPIDVDTSKPVSSPKKKKNKPGVRQQPATTATDDDIPAADASAASRPQPRHKGMPVTRPGTQKKAQPAGDAAAADGTSPLGDGQATEADEKQQRLAAALGNEDARVAEADQKLKERTEMARQVMLADQGHDLDISREEDIESDYAEENEPEVQQTRTSKVCDPNTHLPVL